MLKFLLTSRHGAAWVAGAAAACAALVLAFTFTRATRAESALGTFRTEMLRVDSTSTFGGTAQFNQQAPGGASATFGDPVAGRGWYVTNNELNQGYGYALPDIGFLNYSGQAAGAAQFRSLWIGNGKQAATPIVYVNGVNNRVGINTLAAAHTLGVDGTFEVTGNSFLTGGASSTAGLLTWGPLGGNGGLSIDPVTGSTFFEPFTATANPWGIGFLTPAPEAPFDIRALPFAPGTANPRTDTNPTLLQGLALVNYDTTAADLYVTDMFFDSSHTKAAGANALNDVLLRLDANGPLHGGGVRHATALWIDKGEFRNSGHTTYAVRPSTGGGPTAPPVISACGAAPDGSAVGNDNGGTITVGGGAPASCTLTFQLEWVDHTATPITPTCFVQSPENVAFTFTPTSTTLTINWTAGSPTTIGWHCFGHDDTVPGP